MKTEYPRNPGVTNLPASDQPASLFDHWKRQSQNPFLPLFQLNLHEYTANREIWQSLFLKVRKIIYVNLGSLLGL
jgi:hypothetical protein